MGSRKEVGVVLLASYFYHPTSSSFLFVAMQEPAYQIRFHALETFSAPSRITVSYCNTLFLTSILRGTDTTASKTSSPMILFGRSRARVTRLEPCTRKQYLTRHSPLMCPNDELNLSCIQSL